MRFIRPLIYAVLLVSIAVNVVLYRKNERLRPQVRVNSQTFTKKEFHDWLEREYGPQTEAKMVRYYLIMQEAEKQGVKPTSDEIKKRMDDEEDLRPDLAATIRREPWVEAQFRQQVEERVALVNLLTKDQKPTEDEIKQYYENTPAAWDTTTRLYVRAFQCTDREHADRAKSLLTSMIANKIGPGTTHENGQKRILTDASILVDQLKPNVEFLSSAQVDGMLTFEKPLTQPSPQQLVNKMAAAKVGDIQEYPTSNGIILLVLEGRKEGEHKTLADPETRKRVEERYKLEHAGNDRELLRKLWDAADVEVDPPTLKPWIEKTLLPDRANQEKVAAGAR